MLSVRSSLLDRSAGRTLEHPSVPTAWLEAAEATSIAGWEGGRMVHYDAELREWAVYKYQGFKVAAGKIFHDKKGR